MLAAFASNGLPEPTAADIRHVIGLSLPIAIGRVAHSDDQALIEKLVESYRTHFRRTLEATSDREPLYPRAVEALDRLRNQPDTVLGIATGKGLAGVHRILALHGLTDYFVTLQTPDHNPSKPHPGMLQRAMAETGFSHADTVMIGDTVFDMEMARNAGTRSVGVTWGYHDPSDLIRVGAGAVIGSYDDLDAAIQRVLE
jgi:phosphoglycolate phosphatase